jgi:SAM-dependent methyltransferase
MKGRESGMPEEEAWDRFFDTRAVVERLLAPAPASLGDVVEFGCGYGTFTVPAARLARGVVTALDIEPEMAACVQRKAHRLGLANIRPRLRDFVEQGSGLDDASQCHAMIYNLLHLENPVDLLREAARNLRPGGGISVIHWRSDIATPRGPSLAIRPTAGQCSAWLAEAGFHSIQVVGLEDICPYHFGLIAVR